MRIAKSQVLNEQGRVETNVRSLEKDVRLIATALQGRIRFGAGGDGSRGENIAGEFQTFTSNIAADTEDAITHGLGSVPIGFIVTKLDKGAVVYDSGTAWTETTIYLKTNTASTAVEIFLLK